jgi:hypothetical protein
MSFLNREDELGRLLRAQRPEPSRAFVDGIVEAVGRSRGRSRGSTRLGIAVAFSAAAVAALAATGGLSYAASGVTHAADAAVHVVAPATKAAPRGSLGSAQAQYKVAVCYHGHTLEVDSHAAGVLIRNGGSAGSCSGGSFAPAAKQQVMCFAHNNVWVLKTDVAKFEKLGFKKGFCKKP